MESAALTCSSKESDIEQAKKVKKNKKTKPSQSICFDNENNHFVTANENSISVLEPEASHRAKSSQKKSDRKKSCVTLDQSIINVDLSETFDSFSTDIATPSTSKNINVSTVLKPNNSVDLANNSLSKSSALSFEDEKMQCILTTESSRAEPKELNNTSPNKRYRRRRKRSRKNSQKVETAVSPNDADNTSFNTLPSVIADQYVKRKHIHYSLSPVKTDSCVDDNQYHELPSGTFVKESKSSKARQFNDYPKISTPAQSVGCGSPNWHVSQMSTRNTLSYVSFFLLISIERIFYFSAYI